MCDWTTEDYRKVGNSLATFVRKRKTGVSAIKAWRDHYKQLDILFSEVEGELAKRGERLINTHSGAKKHLLAILSGLRTLPLLIATTSNTIPLSISKKTHTHTTHHNTTYNKPHTGFKEFMVTIANNTARDSMYGMVYRVGVGAALSSIDAATDFYTISTYYQSEDLMGQADALVAMILINLSLQILVVVAQYRRMGDLVKIREALICLFFLRPIVDAYRVSINHEDDEATASMLTFMVTNKYVELATESVPACVLQLYVWIMYREQAGTFALLLSIGVCALTSGFTSALISFDFDTDEVSVSERASANC